MFIVKLKAVHDASGKSMYRVFRDTGLARNTVALYVLNDSVRVANLYSAVMKLAEYYGVDWRDVVTWQADAEPAVS